MKKFFKDLSSEEINMFVYLAYKAIDEEFCFKRNCEHMSPSVTNDKCIECLFEWGKNHDTER